MPGDVCTATADRGCGVLLLEQASEQQVCLLHLLRKGMHDMCGLLW
jgi:hypothetical protein